MPIPSNHPHPAFRCRLAFLLFAPVLVSSPALAQTPPPPVAASAPLVPAAFTVGDLHPALANVQSVISGLSISHWKTSSAARAAIQQDVASMQRDLSGTLPGLMSQAEAANGSGALSPAFAVFRNLDALYDVLLRVTETAAVAGSGPDANTLEEARAGLEDGRAKLGAWLLQSITAQDARITKVQAPPPPPPPPPPRPTPRPRLPVPPGLWSTTGQTPPNRTKRRPTQHHSNRPLRAA